MPNRRMNGDFDLIDSDYPECESYITSDVTLNVGADPAQVSVTIEAYGQTPNGRPRFLLTVWNSKTKPTPRSFTLKLGARQIVRGAGKKKGGKP